MIDDLKLLYPPEERNKNNKIITAKDRIMDVIRENKISWPAEISELTGITSNIYTLLAILTKEGYLERIKVYDYHKKYKEIPQELKERIKYLWSRGLRGDTIKIQMTFYRIKKDPFVEEEAPEI